MPGPTSHPRLWHDLRSQVNQITGYSEMMSEEAAENGRAETFDELKRIDESGCKIAALVDRYSARGDAISKDELQACMDEATPILGSVAVDCQALRGEDGTAEWEGDLDVIRGAADECRSLIQAAITVFE